MQKNGIGTFYPTLPPQTLLDRALCRRVVSGMKKKALAHSPPPPLPGDRVEKRRWEGEGRAVDANWAEGEGGVGRGGAAASVGGRGWGRRGHQEDKWSGERGSFPPLIYFMVMFIFEFHIFYLGVLHLICCLLIYILHKKYIFIVDTIISHPSYFLSIPGGEGPTDGCEGRGNYSGWSLSGQPHPHGLPILWGL